MTVRVKLGWIALLGAALLLSACSPRYGDLQQWMDAERQRMHPTVEPVREPTEYVPLDYVEASQPDPFGQRRLTRVLQAQSSVSPGSNLIAAELNRRREPLEAYPLDTMSMVGTLDQGGKTVALLRVDQLLYQIRVGDYLGQNYGRVMKIDEGGVTLREIVQDGVGEWIERPAKLDLQENKNG